MRVMMIGPSGVIAMRRPISWALKQGHEVCLVDYSNIYAKSLPPNCRFVPFIARGANRLQKLFRTQKAGLLVEWAGALQLRLIAQWFRPDVIHVHRLDMRALCAAKARLAPLIVSAWGSLNHLLIPELKFADLSLARQALLASDALIVETPHLISACHSLVGKPLRVELMPLGVNTEHFRPGYVAERALWRQSLDIPEEATVLFSPRGWLEIYNHHQILEAYGLAFERFNKPTTLAFLTLGHGYYEKANQYYQRIEKQAEQLGVSASIRWIPPTPFEQMPTLYALADVVINYPSTDAFPSTLLEGAASERAIISSALVSYEGTFVEKYCRLAPPNNPAALAEAMVEVVNASGGERAASLSEARQVMIEKYEEKALMEQLFTLYRELALKH